MPSLFVIQGRDQGKRFELENGTAQIGRDSNNTIKLHDTEVSRNHARIKVTDEGSEWIDDGSSNGSFVNSLRVTNQQLKSGDRIQIGRTLMIYTGPTKAPATAAGDAVGIVGKKQNDSRIIKSISQEEGSQLLGSFENDESPWLARARSNLQIMYRTALAVSHTLDIDQLLERIMELIFEWVDADRGCVMLVDRETDALIPKVRRDRKDETSENKLEISKTILDYVRANREGVLTSNARDDERWDMAASIVKLGVREAICVPMQGRYDMVGIIYIDTFTPPEVSLQNPGKNKFSEEHLKLMVAIGHQAALAVEDTSYYSAMMQAERLAAVGQTIASLSHHIKNILQGIRGGSYLIEEGLKADDAEITRKGWGIVERNQDRISKLVMDMLTFSKEREPDLSPNDINEVVRDVAELMQSRASEMNVALEVAVDETMPILTFDAEGIHRAILNIVTNAIDASSELEDRKGKVIIATSLDTEAQTVHIQVTDNGTGIGPDSIDKIFTVFESNKGNRGTGLGLPVSKKVVQEHSGEIRVDSVLNQGSTFTITLPAIYPEPRATTEIPLD
ncbi:MAG: FHA domain-containing protein [Planctomycetales bacterium]|nr:FHA domain-containing protein [Planctomycetales bacterium]